MAKKTKTTISFFPFYGAGEASYYEWAEVIIRFEKKPTPDQLKKIISLSPKPIRPEKDDFNGRMLIAGGGQFINMEIQKEYDKGDIPKAAIDAFGDIETASEFYSSEKALTSFNQHIENWLKEIHEFCPIQFAYRMEDGEAGGTQLSDWHTESMKGTKKLLEKLEKDKDTFKQTEEEGEDFKHALEGIIAFSKITTEKIPTKLVNYIFPTYQLSNLFKKGKIKDILKIITKNIKNENFLQEVITYLNEIKIEDKKERKKFISLVKEILKTKNNFLFKYNAYGIATIAKVAILEKDQKIIKSLENQISINTDYVTYINVLGEQAHRYLSTLSSQIGKKKKEYIDISIQLFQLALNIKVKDLPSTLDLATYCNALWILQNDNTGLPINKKINNEFLAKCLPFGPKNPGIYFNAACLYGEMNEVEKIIECIELAKKYKYDQYSQMINEIKTHKIFANARKDERLQKLIS